jgi:hypothetical protein
MAKTAVATKTAFGGDFNLYTKVDDKAILTRQIRGVGKNLTDGELGEVLDRTPGAIRQRRYILTHS